MGRVPWPNTRYEPRHGSGEAWDGSIAALHSVGQVPAAYDFNANRMTYTP